MTYCIDPSVEEPIMLIDTHIGYDKEDGMGINGALFQTELLQLDSMGKKRIQVWINSPGGIVMDGYNICNAILKSKTKVDTYCIGCAASIAGVIFQMGRKRYMADYSWLMYHMPFGGSDKSLDTIAGSLIKMVSQRTGQNEEFVKTTLKRETYIDAKEALEIGFCDEVEATEDFNVKRLAGATTVKAKWEAGSEVMNSLKNLDNKDLNNNKNRNMVTLKLITNRLGLNEDAKEDNILNAIDKVLKDAESKSDEFNEVANKAKAEAKTAKEALAEMEDKLKEMEEDKAKLKAKYDALKSEVENKAAEDAKAKAALEEEDCKNMVTDFAKVGRIKNDEAVITQWVNTAKAIGKAQCKTLIEALPLNKEMPAAPIEQTLEKDEVPQDAMQRMAAIKNRTERK